MTLDSSKLSPTSVSTTFSMWSRTSSITSSEVSVNKKDFYLIYDFCNAETLFSREKEGESLLTIKAHWFQNFCRTKALESLLNLGVKPVTWLTTKFSAKTKVVNMKKYFSLFFSLVSKCGWVQNVFAIRKLRRNGNRYVCTWYLVCFVIWCLILLEPKFTPKMREG